MPNLVDYIKFFWCGHITNWPWRSRLQRRNTRNLAFTKMKMRQLWKYIPYIKSLKVGTEVDRTLPYSEEKVFSLWLQGLDTAPHLVKKCVESLRDKFGDRFILLDETSVTQYVDLPKGILEKWESGKMLPAHFSDIVRLELLAKYGGYWFDATDYITGDVPQEIMKADFFVFMTSPRLLLHTFIQNYFIRARKGDRLLRMWLDLVEHYWENEDKAASYYLVQHLFYLLVTWNEEAQHLFMSMPKICLDGTQVIWHETGNDPFDEDKYAEMCSGAFFQKCTYKKKTGIIRGIIPGSMADFLINGKKS